MSTFNFNSGRDRVFGLGGFSVPPPEQPAPEPINILDSAAMVTDAAVDDFATKLARSQAMAVALTFVAEGDFTYDTLEGLVIGMTSADMDSDGEISEDEEDAFNEILSYVAEAFGVLGAGAENVAAFINDEDDAAGATMGTRLAGRLEETKLTDDDIIARFALQEQLVLDGWKKVVKGGKVVLKKIRTKKVRLNAAQKAALKKARRKANSAAAKFARKKSMKMRKARGI